MCAMLYSAIVFFFFFKQKTAYEMRISDWSSDVCSSDLSARRPFLAAFHDHHASMVATSMTQPYAVLLLACLVLLGACSRDEPPAAQAPANESADTALGRTLGKVAEKVRTKLEHENITLSSSDAEAKAEITPQGDLLIDGKKVATDEAQRALLLEYRAGIIAVAAAGTDIGMKGADFGLRTAGKALRGVFSGNSDEIEAEIEADAREFEAQERKI